MGNLKTAQELKETYLSLYNEGSNLTQIAKQIDCTITKVSRDFRKLGIPVQKTLAKERSKKISKEMLVPLVEQGLTLDEIGNKFQITGGVVFYLLKKFNLETIGTKKKNQFLIGQKFGKIQVLSLAYSNDRGRYYNCICDCGKERVILATCLRGDNGTRSCGSWACNSLSYENRKFHPDTLERKQKERESHIGEKHNMLTIIGVEKVAVENMGFFYICKCDCGNICKRLYCNLVSETIKSCGCLHKENSSLFGLNNNTDRFKKTWFFILNGEKVKCRSSYEVLYANYLIDNNIKFQYEPTTFKLQQGMRYTPDFYLMDEDIYVELKGFDFPKQRIKRDIFEKTYKLRLLKWDDLVILCNLPFVTYTYYVKKAKKMNFSIEDFYGNRIYQKIENTRKK